jgi:hypothetical protein
MSFSEGLQFGDDQLDPMASSESQFPLGDNQIEDRAEFVKGRHRLRLELDQAAGLIEEARRKRAALDDAFQRMDQRDRETMNQLSAILSRLSQLVSSMASSKGL